VILFRLSGKALPILYRFFWRRQRKSGDSSSRCLTQSQRVTDGKTDERTDGRLGHKILRVCIVSYADALLQQQQQLILLLFSRPIISRLTTTAGSGGGATCDVDAVRFTGLTTDVALAVTITAWRHVGKTPLCPVSKLTPCTTTTTTTTTTIASSSSSCEWLLCSAMQTLTYETTVPLLNDRSVVNGVPTVSHFDIGQTLYILTWTLTCFYIVMKQHLLAGACLSDETKTQQKHNRKLCFGFVAHVRAALYNLRSTEWEHKSRQIDRLTDGIMRRAA